MEFHAKTPRASRDDKVSAAQALIHRWWESKYLAAKKRRKRKTEPGKSEEISHQDAKGEPSGLAKNNPRMPSRNPPRKSKAVNQ